ncbi:MAG: two-component hybrid sensor and regulator [Gemmatimonadetes bacterium]|nr:two-component hybrid sensor and regulator [Gemmatimonadota bacterium]
MTESTNSSGEDASLPGTDEAALERLKRFGGGKLLGEMISLFLEAAPERINAAKDGVVANDVKATEMALHALKSSSAQLGAMRMQRLCERGETLARSGTLENVAGLVSSLEEEFPRVQSWLERARRPEVA